MYTVVHHERMQPLESVRQPVLYNPAATIVHNYFNCTNYLKHGKHLWLSCSEVQFLYFPRCSLEIISL